MMINRWTMVKEQAAGAKRALSVYRAGVVLLGLCFVLGACSTVPKNATNLCSVFKENGSWYKAAKKSEKRWGTPIAVSMAFIKVESGYNDDAKPRRNRFLWVIPTTRPSSAQGYAQAVEGTWTTYQRASGNRDADRNHFTDAVDFVAWYIGRNSRELGLSTSDAYSNYLAYHEGPAAFRRGSYRGKGSLQTAARRVQSTASNYSAQLDRCRDDLEDGFLFF